MLFQVPSRSCHSFDSFLGARAGDLVPIAPPVEFRTELLVPRVSQRTSLPNYQSSFQFINTIKPVFVIANSYYPRLQPHYDASLPNVER